MYDVHCNACGKEFPFSPASVWSSPGTIRGPQPGMAASVVIQCPHCNQWTRAEVPAASVPAQPKTADV